MDQDLLCNNSAILSEKLFSKNPVLINEKGLHRCWCRMLVTKCVGDNFKMLVTVLAISVTNILYLLTVALGTNMQKMSPRS